MFYASRYDWLRIAKAVMDDYQNNTCVGKYLKEIYNRKIPKGAKEFEDEPGFNKTYSYGGQFHLDYPKIKNKIVFGMGGRSGQAVLIDMEGIQELLSLIQFITIKTVTNIMLKNYY